MSLMMTATIVALVGALHGVPAGPAPGEAGMVVPVSAGAGNTTKATQDSPIRSCFRESCDQVARVPAGATMTWSHFADNQVGNRWYFVTFRSGVSQRAKPEAPPPVTGWIFCGNVTAPC
jgi:hypothetical protein